MLSRLLNISRTMESKFQIPSGSLPRRGRSKQAHSAAAGGSVEDRYIEFTSLYIKQKNKEKKFNQAQSYKILSVINPEYNQHQEMNLSFNGTDISNLKDRMHNELKNTTQVKYCTNTVWSTEITVQKLYKITVQKSDHETERPSIQSIQAIMVNEFTDHTNVTFSLQWETAYLKTTGVGPQNL